MTPEDDVNKDTGTNDGDKAVNDGSVDKPIDAASAAGDGKADSPDDTASSPLVDDIDLAASAQSQADAAIAKAMAGNDDPLGFGDQRMEGDSSSDSADTELTGEAAGDAPAEVEVGDEMAVMRAQLAESEGKVANQTDQLLRMQAEMENQRKRAQNDVSKAHKFALEKFALDLLPVKDSLEMGLLAATAEEAEPTKIIEGSELTLKMLAQALEKYQIVEINPVDEKFDPELHQAMSMAPVEGKEPNTVASVMQKGYTLNDRLIRPALVMVAK